MSLKRRADGGPVVVLYRSSEPKSDEESLKELFSPNSLPVSLETPEHLTLSAHTADSKGIETISQSSKKLRFSNSVHGSTNLVVVKNDKENRTHGSDTPVTYSLDGTVQYLQYQLQYWLKRLAKVDTTECLARDSADFLQSPHTKQDQQSFSVKSIYSYFQSFTSRPDDSKIASLIRILALLSFNNTINVLKHVMSVATMEDVSYTATPPASPLSTSLVDSWQHYLSALPNHTAQIQEPSIAGGSTTSIYTTLFSVPSLRRPTLSHPWARSKAKVEDVTYVSPSGNFIVVADGHGGRDAAEWFTHKITERLDELFREDWNFASAQERKEFRAQVVYVFRKTDLEFCLDRKRDWLEGHNRRDDGCTMTVSAIYKNFFININIGDSKAILFSLDPKTNEFSPCFVSRDHDLQHEKVIGVLKRGGRACDGDDYARELYRLSTHERFQSPETFFTASSGLRMRLAPHPICEERFRIIPTKYINMSDSLGDALFKEGLLSPCPLEDQEDGDENGRVEVADYEEICKDVLADDEPLGPFEGRPDITFVCLDNCPDDRNVINNESRENDQNEPQENRARDDNEKVGLEDVLSRERSRLGKRYVIMMATDGFWDMISTDSCLQFGANMSSIIDPFDSEDEAKSHLLARILSRTDLSKPLTESEYRTEMKRTCCGLSDYTSDPFGIYKNISRMRYLDDLSLVMAGVQIGGNGWSSPDTSSRATKKQNHSVTTRSRIQLSSEYHIFG